MSWEGDERRKTQKEFLERMGIIEHRVGSLEEHLKTTTNMLEEIKETHTKMKTLIGAITFVISALWLVISTFKEAVVHWLLGK